jgi:hypothetical protein
MNAPVIRPFPQGQPIRLHQPVKVEPDGTRIHYFPRRSLGSAEFLVQGQYLDHRLLELGGAQGRGVLDGFALQPAYWAASDGAPPPLTVQPGNGVTLDGRAVRLTAPLRATWADLAAIRARVAGAPANLADGAYFLTLQPIAFETVHGPPQDPRDRQEVDPTLDERRDSFVELLLSAPVPGPVPVPAAAASASDIALYINRVAAGLSPALLASVAGGTLPIGLVLVLGGAPVVVSAAGGRLPAPPAGLHGLLLAQVRETLALAVVAHGAAPFVAADLAAIRAQLRFVPAAGELPLGFLLQPDAATASSPFWPPGMDVDLATIRVSEARGVIARELWRAPIDLQSPTEDGVLLLLAVPDQDWQPDLLDNPRADPLLPADLFQAYVTAASGFIGAHRAWSALYGGLGSHASDANRRTLGFLRLAVNDAATRSTLTQQPDAQFLALLDTAGTIDGITAWLQQQAIPIANTPDAATLTAQLAADGYRILDVEPAAPVVPDTVVRPLVQNLPANSAYQDWLRVTNTGDPKDDSNPASEGALLRLILLQAMQAILALAARRLEIQLNGHDRLIALQRAHLDTLSTYGSSLAGGVPADGKGMQVARMLPFIRLTPTVAAAGGAPTTPTAAAPSTLIAARSFTATNVASERLGTRPIQANGSTLTPPGRTRVPININGSTAGALLGRGQDAAAEVATQLGAIASDPQFQFQPQNYGNAAHITPAESALQVLKSGLDNLAGLAKQIGLEVPAPTAFPPPQTGIDSEHAAYANMLIVGRDLLAHIDAAERNSQIIEARYRTWRDRLTALGAAIAAAQRDVEDGRRVLIDAMRVAGVPAGDYAAAQRLVQEEIDRITAATAKRSKVLNDAVGLFYVRTRQTPVLTDLPTPLPLVGADPGDLVPGCAADHDGPPAVVQPFLDWVLELPLWDFRPVQPLWQYLPDRDVLSRLIVSRSARLADRSPTLLDASAFGNGPAAPDLLALHQANQGVFTAQLRIATLPVSDSLAEVQRAAARIFALPDILPLPVNPLRRAFESFRARMEAACGCLAEKLNALPPSTRFVLYEQARTGTLPALTPEDWPLVGVTTTDAFAAHRALAALVAWLRNQVADAPSAAAVPALSNLVRALVIGAAHGDPSQALSGSVTAATPGFRIGDPVRVTLNRPPAIGTMLHVFDASRTLVGTVQVEDNDANGTATRLVASFRTNIADIAGFTLAAAPA